jgi:hypothetical protein
MITLGICYPLEKVSSKNMFSNNSFSTAKLYGFESGSIFAKYPTK